MSLKNQVYSGLLWSTLEKWGGKLFTLLIFIVLARLLDPEAFGIVALSMVFIRFINIFVDQGFTDAIIQRDKIEEAHLNSAFWASLILGSLLCGLAILSANFFAELLGEPKIAEIIKWLSLSVFIKAFIGVQVAIFKRNLQFKVLSIRSLISFLSGGIFGIIAAVNGMGVWSLVIQQISTRIVEVFVLWFSSDWFPKLSFSFKHLKELFSFGINVMGTNLLNFLSRNSDDLIIGYFLGPTALGFYTVAYKLIRTITNLISSVGTQVAFPAFSKIKNDKPKMRKAFYSVTEITSLLSFPVFTIFAATASLIIPIVFGDQWVESVLVMQILCMVGMLQTIFRFNNSVILACGKSFWQFILNMIKTSLNIIGFLIAVQWGIFAVAIAYVTRAYITSPLPLFAVKKLIEINYIDYLRRFLPSIISAGFMFLIVQLLVISDILNEYHELVKLIILLGIGMLCYTSSIYFLFPKTRQKIYNLFADFKLLFNK